MLLFILLGLLALALGTAQIKNQNKILTNILTNAIIYIDTVGNIKYLPYACKDYCPPGKPGCGVVKCNLTTTKDCIYTAFYNAEGDNTIVGLYTVPPESACDRETILIDKMGHYRIYIDKVSETYRMNVQNTLEPLTNNTISIIFTLGYDY